MIVIPRDLARSFRAVASRCVAGRPRGPAPPVVCSSRGGTRTLWTRTAEAVLLHVDSQRGPDATLVVPMTVLAAVEGPTADPVELSVGRGLAGTARWSDRDGPQAVSFNALLPGRQHDVPDLPAGWRPVPATFLTALDECGRTTARDATRFALHHVQVAGRAGRLTGTDGRVAFLWSGFKLPFADDLLVPAVPAFGCRELEGEKDVRVGRTPGHLAVAAGPWRVLLPIDTTGRFPDVAGVVPKGSATVAGVDDGDAADLLRRLPGLPGVDKEGRPVTLDLEGWTTVRARSEDGGVVELPLTRSPVSGPAVRVAVDRRVLTRALGLGCVTLRVTTPDKPVVAEGPDRTLVFLTLDCDLAVPPPTTTRAGVPSNPIPERRSTPMKSNGKSPDVPPPTGGGPDPLAEAEALRAALADATGRAARLVTALKHGRREKKALAGVWAGLQRLGLGTGDRDRPK